MSKVKKILIISPTRIGDLLCSIPAMKYCKETWPQHEVNLLVGPSNAGIVPYFQDYDGIVELPDWSGKKYSTFFKYAKHFRGDFDICIHGADPRKSKNILMWLMKPKESYAYSESNWHSKLITHPTPHDYEKRLTRHVALQVLNAIAPGVESLPDRYIPHLRIPEQILKTYSGKVDEIFSPISSKPGPSILIALPNNRPFCVFSLENYASILNELYKDLPFKVFVSGMSGSEGSIEEMRGMLEMPSAPLITPDFNLLMTCMARIDAGFLCDGGLVHMMAGLDKPQVVLFGKTSVERWRPLSENACVLYHPEDVNKVDRGDIMNEMKAMLNRLF